MKTDILPRLCELSLGGAAHEAAGVHWSYWRCGGREPACRALTTVWRDAAGWGAAFVCRERSFSSDLVEGVFGGNAGTRLDRWPERSARCSLAGGVTANRLQEFANELVDLQPDVLFAVTTPSLKAVLRVSRTLPIVFTQVTDPVAQGLIESLPHPGGNITGFSNFEREIATKLMQVLKDIAPRTTRVAVMFNPDTAPYYKLYMGAIGVAAASFGMKAFEAAAHNRAEIETVPLGANRRTNRRRDANP